MPSHVLLDGDGVMQDFSAGWYRAMEPFLGERLEEFFEAVWSEDLPVWRGEGDYLDEIDRLLREFDVSLSAAEAYQQAWLRIEVIEDSLRLVDDLRSAGYGVHLGTNQDRGRAAYMRSVLGYEEVFDVSCYSCELGVAKPDPDFFIAAAAAIGAECSEIVFVDDNPANVASARSAGLSALCWHFEKGQDQLRAGLAEAGVSVSPRSRRSVEP